MVILDEYNNSSQHERDLRKEYVDQVTTLNNKITKARELLLNEDIEPVDFKMIKSEAEHKINILECKIADLKSGFIKIGEVEKIIDQAIANLCKLDKIYYKSDPHEQQEIIGSMYPEKFTFEDLQHRTVQVSDPYKVIYLINSELQGKKNGTSGDFSCLSHRVILLELCFSILKPLFSIF